MPERPLPAAAVAAGREFTLRVDYADTDSRVLVAVDADGSTVGLASGGVCRDPEPPTAWELYSINLLLSVRGTGLADDLVTAVLGTRPACVWVLLDNDRAHAFYRRHGFVADGAERPHGDLGAPERRMVRPRREA